ncbi:polysaccharide ABC transporter ATP-binding protein [Reichenbachiella sp.]|uniref:ABC transporter ATP-binding protein n=1 Tax=Reichenbachiella sp. TaxID=2184521 RepID=UPI003296ABAC
MTDSVVHINHLSKVYGLGKSRHTSLAEVMRSYMQGTKKKNKEFYALNDVSLKIEKGEALGIIGKNGAGKSTLLKVLSRITYPTSGEVSIRGRVSSLLEVGTGFHPELTGRENIFLNGTILGMRRQEIKSKLDEIIAFSDVEKFIDTPVKHYSSGMYVRLAFSVAAHLEPEILIIDEVLAVGDIEFQKKCLGKMNEVAGLGRTVIFVSHNMNAVKNLCSSAVFMKQGTMSEKCTVEEAVKYYTEGNLNNGSSNFPILHEEFVINDFRVHQKGAFPTEFNGDMPVEYEIEIEILRDLNNFRIGIMLKDQFGELIMRSLLTDWQEKNHSLKKGKYVLRSSLPSNLLTSGSYYVQIHGSIYGLKDFALEEKTSELISINKPQKFNSIYPGEVRFGNIINSNTWTIESN